MILFLTGCVVSVVTSSGAVPGKVYRVNSHDADVHAADFDGSLLGQFEVSEDSAVSEG
jgi:hypothetical protein